MGLRCGPIGPPEGGSDLAVLVAADGETASHTGRDAMRFGDSRPLLRAKLLVPALPRTAKARSRLGRAAGVVVPPRRRSVDNR